MSAAWIAALPMYDFPELREVHDRWWASLRHHLTEVGLSDAPAQLSRDLPHEATWSHPRLLFGQACEYPLTRRPAGVRLVATPVYRAPGCVGATYRSAIVVRRDDPATVPADLRGRRGVVNESTSNSGMNLLRAALAPVAQGQAFFQTVEVSGAHRRSMQLVAGGAADVAAIDCVTLAHVTRIDPTLAGALRILDWTPATPSLPLIATAALDAVSLERVRSALRALTRDPVMDLLRDQLFLEGFDLAPPDGFTAVLQLERAAQRLGYPTLH